MAMYHFDDEDRVWLSAYDEGDTILFKSAITGEMDTMIVKEKYIKDTYNPFMENEAHNIMQAYGYLDLDFSHHGEPVNCGMSIESERGILKVFLAFAGRIVEKSESKLGMGRTTIGGVTYTDACVCYGRRAELAEVKVKYFVWSKSKGLIQYRYRDEGVYTFYKKLSRE